MTVVTRAASGLGLSRNEAARCFPAMEDVEALESLRGEIVEALVDGSWERPWQIYNMDELSEVETVYLVEKGLMTPSFAESDGESRGFAVYGEGQASLEINGIDHVRLLGFRTGERLAELWTLLAQLDDHLEKTVTYAFDPHWGYLTSQPAMAGSGMRAWATLHVPALMVTGRLGRIAVRLASDGLALAPLWGGAGGVVQVFNVGREGMPEDETMEQIDAVSHGIMKKERSVGRMLLRDNPIQARDHIGRSLGVGQHARSMNFSEAVNVISAVQLGVEHGVLEMPGLSGEPIVALMGRLQPAHIVMDHGDGTMGSVESPETDQTRARLLRIMFAGGYVR